MKSFVRTGLAVLALITAMIGRAESADEPMTLRLVPDAIALQPGLSHQDVVLIAQLPAKTSVERANLSWVSSPGIDIQRLVEPKTPATSDLVWKLKVVAQPGIARDTVIGFVLEYQLKGGEEGTTARAGVATAKVQVNYAILSLAQSIKVTVEHGFDSLTAGVPRGALLVIDNAGAEDVTLESVVEQQPSYIEVRPCFKLGKQAPLPCTALPVIIPGRSIVRVPIEIEASSSIPPGALHLLMNLTFSRGSGTSQEKATIRIVDKVEAGIPGFAEIKTVLQIPSLFFLPGVLVVLTMGLIWGVAHRGEAAPAYIPSAREGHFYLISITFSLVISWIYSRYVLRETQGLLEAFSLIDVARIWFGSIVLGCILYGLIASIKPSIALAKRIYAYAYAPRTKDEPEDILRKMVLHRKRLQLPAFMTGPAAGSRRVFDLDFAAPDDQHIWAVSEIALTLAASAAGSETELRGILHNDDAEGLRRFLERHPGQYLIDWDNRIFPTLVARADLIRPLGALGLVRLH